MRRLSSLFALTLPLAGCAGTVDRSATVADAVGPAHKLYVSKCAKCHKFYDPATYSDADWKVWMGKMSRKAKLKPEQEQMLSQYIEENLRGKHR